MRQVDVMVVSQGCVHGSTHAAGEGFAKTDKPVKGLACPLLVQRGKEHILAGFGDEEEVVM